LGGGTLTLSGTNSYTGGTNVFDGTLVATNPQAIADGSNLYVGMSAAFFAPVVPAPASGGTAAASGVAAVPEPGSLALLAAGAAAAIAVARRRKRISHRRRLHRIRAESLKRFAIRCEAPNNEALADGTSLTVGRASKS
jgi:autotransporter-associated beta strand protein